LRILFKTIDGLEEIASDEISEKLHAKDLVIGPYGRPGWISCVIEGYLLERVRALRSVVETHILVHDEKYGQSFSIDTFADRVVEKISSYAPSARTISVSAYSIRGMPSQREIQGTFSKRIVSKLGARCNLRDYDTALRISLLKRIALASIDLEIQPGNIPKIETHPTPLFPPIAYCMIRLTSPQVRERFLDPMCGCGTIPLMAALEWTNLQVTGSDISSDYISCATRNAEKLKLESRVKFLVSDIADLEGKRVSADVIAVNPPYGIAVRGHDEASSVYAILLEKAFRILIGGGRIAVITPYRSVIDKLASKLMFKVKSVWNVNEGELPRNIHILQRP
jgi:23S rRNA G2445 N2-methylase RlmL